MEQTLKSPGSNYSDFPFSSVRFSLSSVVLGSVVTSRRRALLLKLIVFFEHFPKGVLGIFLSDGNAPFYWVSLSYMFSCGHHQNKAIFLERLSKDVKGGDFIRDGCC